MIRVVLDTNIIVSAMLVPAGKQASILLLALRGDIALCASLPVLEEYEEVLRRPRFRLRPAEIATLLQNIRGLGTIVTPSRTLSVSTDEADNRFLECAEAADADYLVTGNTRHFPLTHHRTQIVTGSRFLEILADTET